MPQQVTTMTNLFTIDALISLLTLTLLEIVLGIDNVIFVSILIGRLTDAKQKLNARKVWMFAGIAVRIGLLMGLGWLVKNGSKALFEIAGYDFNLRNCIMFAGGVFLLFKTVKEIHHKLEGEEEGTKGKSSNTVGAAILQIALLNIVFSFDSILTAIGLVSASKPPVGFGQAGAIEIMIMAIIISIIIMMVFAGPVSKFVNNHPTIQIFGLSFLILIGVMLLAEGAHLANFKFFGGEEAHAIPKGYLYFSIFFSLFVEFLNLKMKKNSKKPVQLNNNKIIDEKLTDTDLSN